MQIAWEGNIPVLSCKKKTERNENPQLFLEPSENEVTGENGCPKNWRDREYTEKHNFPGTESPRASIW